jgi:hypothetical protein
MSTPCVRLHSPLQFDPSSTNRQSQTTGADQSLGKMKKLLIFVLLSIVGYGEGRVLPENYQTLDGFAKLTELITQEDLLAVIEQTETVVVYEGLPHPMFEAPLFFREAQRDDVTWFHDIPFYSAPRALEPNDRDAVMEFLKSPFPRPDYDEGPVMKMCGGFHPDFCVMFSGRSGRIGVMICFTCADMIAFSDEAYWLQMLDKKPGRDELKKVLFRYARLRPKEEKPNQSTSSATR